MTGNERDVFAAARTLAEALRSSEAWQMWDNARRQADESLEPRAREAVGDLVNMALQAVRFEVLGEAGAPEGCGSCGLCCGGSR